MMKEVRKALGTFWCTQFLQGVIFDHISLILMFYHESQLHKHSRHVQHIFSCRKLSSTLGNTIEVNFTSFFLLTCMLRGSPYEGEPQSAFWLAVQSIMEVVVPQLKGECFAPPSVMIDEVALRRVDAGMGVGSPSSDLERVCVQNCVFFGFQGGF